VEEIPIVNYGQRGFFFQVGSLSSLTGLCCLGPHSFSGFYVLNRESARVDSMPSSVPVLYDVGFSVRCVILAKFVSPFQTASFSSFFFPSIGCHSSFVR